MKIDKLPFYWRLKAKDELNIVPDHMPFEYDFVESLQLLVQKNNPKTLEYLEKIYKAEANIGYLQDINQIAKSYGVDFLNFIETSLNTWGKNANSILEIGCGGCALIEQLMNKGYNVVGVDPSPVAKRDGKRKGIKIINEFFPSPLFQDNVDMIFHCDVLEHVFDPVGFLMAQRKQLSANGLIIISLPDCNEGVEKGEISMAMHQHINYFDNDSLRNTIEAAGLKVLTIETAQYGGSLYCCAMNQKNGVYEKKIGTTKFDTFTSLAERNSNKIKMKISAVMNDPLKTVGFYVPLRALPYLSLMEFDSNFRFFDDTTHWYAKTFDGLNVPTENFNDLKNKPVTDLFIMSLTFGDVIKTKIQREISEITHITVLRELLEVR